VDQQPVEVEPEVAMMARFVAEVAALRGDRGEQLASGVDRQRP
jgi:hypothetical protein